MKKQTTQGLRKLARQAWARGDKKRARQFLKMAQPMDPIADTELPPPAPVDNMSVPEAPSSDVMSILNQIQMLVGDAIAAVGSQEDIAPIEGMAPNGIDTGAEGNML